MKIERIKIDGFGCFQHWEQALAPELNVIFGPNEAGKSTLLSFVRATLFGFSKRTEPSRYEPDRGAFGGELLLDTEVGPLWVRRTGSRRRYEGELLLRTASGDRALPSRLSEAMGGISRQLFFQVFAFGLDELAAFDQLAQQGDVAEALFAAGMRGAKRLPQALEELRRSSEAVYLPKGRRELNQLLAELESLQERLRSVGDRPAEYFAKLDQLTGIARELKSTEQELARVRRERNDLARLAAASEDLERLARLERDLEPFPPLEAFPLDATRELEKLSHRHSDALAEVAQAANERAQLSQSLAAAVLPEEWIAAEAPIRDALDAYKAKVEQLDSVKARSAANSLRRRELIDSLQSLDLPFSASELLSIELGPSSRDCLWALARQLQSAKTSIGAAKERADAAVGAIERAEQQIISMGANPPSPPRTVLPRRVVPTLWMLLAAVSVAGPVLFSVRITWLTLSLTALLAMVLFAFERWAAAVLRQATDSFEASQALAAKRLAFLAEQIAAAGSQKAAADEEEGAGREELMRCSAALRSWLEERMLPPETSPERAMELWADLSSHQLRLKELVAEAQALQIEEGLCAATKERLEEAARTAGLSFAGTDEAQAAATEMLERLMAVRETRRRLAQELGANGTRIARAAQQLAELEGMLTRLFEQAGCANEAELRVRDQQAAAFRALRAQERDLVLRVEATTAASVASVAGELKDAGGREAVLQKLQQLESELGRLDAARAALAEQRGRCKALLEGWEADREVASLRSREELLRAEACGLAEKYAVDRLALRLLSEAQRRFEQQQQPRILQLASRAFQELTGGRYVRVYASASEAGSLRVDQADGARWRDEQLSRGTREQLYLAFRLALIQDLGETHLTLPILVDDVLVNFDRQRRRNVVGVFARLSRRHQVIAFTCHDEVKELFAERGAHVLEMTRDHLGLLAASA